MLAVPISLPLPSLRTGPANRPAGAEKPGGSPLIDVALAAALFAFIAGMVALAQRWHAPIREAVVIDLRPRALPAYTLLSLSRGFAAYVLSLVFTLVYGTVAAHNRRAEKIMIPLLDVLPGDPGARIPAGARAGMVALFPRTNVGLELACILMIFTGQAWNMVFSFYGIAPRGPGRAHARWRAIHRFSWWKSSALEVPPPTIGLVWNSMMSMAGGWFFLTVNEAFTLGDQDFRLPGIGSYMTVAIDKGDTRAMAWAIVAMALMIVAVDQLLWRPLVAWSQRFRLEEIGGRCAAPSWVLDLLRRSWLARTLRQVRRRREDRRARAGSGRPPRACRPTLRPGRFRAAMACSVSSASSPLLGARHGRRPPRVAAVCA